ncbi:MAG: PH domain-containing protein [Saprospiraceae bacterium]|nr:PH domain-containing protein [Saprospiraceae bacterium]
METYSDFDTRQILQPALSPGEKLLWTGRPKTGLLLRSGDIFMIPFSLLWGGFAIFWESTVLSGGAPFFFALWGIPFVLIGLYMIIGRFFVDAYQRSKTVYGITDDRIIIQSGIFSSEIKSLNIQTLSDLTIKEKSDGSGTISLGPQDPRSAMMEGMAWPGVKAAPQLAFIPGVRQVYDLLLQLQRRR